MTHKTITCPSCGGPTHPEVGRTHMPCSYCGTALTIPNSMRARSVSSKKVQIKETKFQQPKIDPSSILRKAQPIAIKAWNFYAVWTWLMRLLPACLVVFIVGIFICLALGALPFVLNLIR